MELLLVAIVVFTAGLWVFIVWYLRTSTREFDRQLTRTLWHTWEAGRRRGDDDPPRKGRV